MGYVIRRCSFRRCKTGVYDDYRHFGAGIACIVSHWSDNQYFSDGDFHSGTDADICAEDHCGISDTHVSRWLDAAKNDRVYDTVVE